MEIRRSPLNWICGLILILLPLISITSAARHRSKCPYEDDSIPIWEKIQCDKSDPNTPPVKRLVRLYSRASSKHIQMEATAVNARGNKSSEYARLVLESDNLTGRLKIRSEKTNRYLCMNKKGELVARLQKQKNRTLKRCIFRQIQANSGYSEFESVKYPQWFIGFSKGGVPIKGSRGSRRQKPRYRQFLVINLRPEKKRRNHLKRAIQYNELKKRIIRLLRMKLRL
ncbi:unnamed protein product [Porites lobata]|uniref:Fibroblast growth factor 8 n=1 Tax=Porites lobata TaxID=104759 RepID=A0ABN8N7Z4_9CNID|nr:unnamed protein product [Porites lobata]